MTKYFKLLGIALLATSLAFVSCGDDGDDTTDPGTGTNPPVEDPEPPTLGEVPAGQIGVLFGDTVWTPAVSFGAFYPTEGITLLVAASDQSGQTIPRADVCVYASGQGTFTDEYDETSGYLNDFASYIEYYHRTKLDDGVYYYGDWWAKSVTMNVTAFDATAMTISATVNAVMFDAKSALIDGVGVAAAETKAMTLIANQVAMTDGEAAKSAFLRRK